MTIMAIDYGRSRWGVAIGSGLFAQPLAVLPSQSAWSMLGQLTTSHRPDLIVIGQSEGKMAEESAVFAKEVTQRTGIPTVLSDETLSSQESMALLRQRYAGKRMPPPPYDHYAAALILEHYLEDHAEKS